MQIPPFIGDTEDRWLYTLIPFLEKLNECRDVRSVSDKFNLHMLGYELPKGSSENAKKLSPTIGTITTQVLSLKEAESMGIVDNTCFEEDENEREGITRFASKQIETSKNRPPRFEKKPPIKFSFFGSCI